MNWMWIKPHFYSLSVTFDHAVQAKRLIIKTGYFCGIVGKKFIADSAMAGAKSIPHYSSPFYV
jgi:hypothetical protein